MTPHLEIRIRSMPRLKAPARSVSRSLSLLLHRAVELAPMRRPSPILRGRQDIIIFDRPWEDLLIKKHSTSGVTKPGRIFNWARPTNRPAGPRSRRGPDPGSLWAFLAGPGGHHSAVGFLTPVGWVSMIAGHTPGAILQLCNPCSQRLAWLTGIFRARFRSGRWGRGSN